MVGEIQQSTVALVEEADDESLPFSGVETKEKERWVTLVRVFLSRISCHSSCSRKNKS